MSSENAPTGTPVEHPVRLFDRPHPYYCMNGNAWFLETADHHNRYESAADFLAKFGDSDADMSLVFRWDWGGLGDASAGDEENPLPESKSTVFHVWWIIQRKGFMVSGEFPVTAADEPMLREWLASRWKKLVELWGPVSDCVFDSDSDGDCHRCHNRGGCRASGGPFHATETQQYVHGLIIANANGWVDAVARGAGYEGIAKGHLDGLEECLLRIRQGIVR